MAEPNSPKSEAPPPFDILRTAALSSSKVPPPSGVDYEIIDPLPENPVLDMLLEAMEGRDPQMRAVAVETASAMPGEEVTRWCVGRMRTSSSAARVSLLQIMARRGDPAALPTALSAMRDADESVRVAAVEAAAGLGREMVVGPLVGVLARRGAREREAARLCLLEMPGEAATGAIAKSLEGAPAGAKCVLLEILAGRHAQKHLDVVFGLASDEDRSVRIAALKALGGLAEAESLPRLLELFVNKGGRNESSRERRAAEKAMTSVCSRASKNLGEKESCARHVLAALGRASGRTRCSLLRELGRLGAAAGLATVRAGLTDADADVRDAAVRSLADWPDAAVAPEVLGVLLDLARDAPKETHRVLALRGYVRVVGVLNVEGVRPAEEILEMYRNAAGLAEAWGRPQERKQVLAGLAEVNHVGALEAAAACLDEEALKAEAAVAVVKIAASLGPSHRDKARAALDKVLAAVQDSDENEGVRSQAQEALGSLGGPK